MPRGDRAVVLGGGIAGLLAAHVLAERYPTVIVVERDRLPATACHRRGVPQSRHVHGLLPGGLRTLEELLPGITRRMVDDGALIGDILGNVRWYVRGKRLPQAGIGVTALSASRPVIETAIRQRVLESTNITVHDGREATGLTLSSDRRRVTGVQTSEGSLAADLVVDATGRGSRTLAWLGRLGYPPPPADRVDIGLRYVSCAFTAPPDIIGTDLMVAVGPLPKSRRSGVMQRLEGGRVLVTLAGIRGDRPPLDPQGFTGYAASLAAGDIAELIRAGKPVAGLTQFHCPTYVRQRFEQVTDFPAGLLFIGDSVCSFNPMFAEGISVAARAATILRTTELTAAPFFSALSSTLDSGPPLPAAYLAELENAAPHDLILTTAYVRVAALIDSPAELLSPAIRERVAGTNQALSR